jgi:hypothetical protein
MSEHRAAEHASFLFRLAAEDTIASRPKHKSKHRTMTMLNPKKKQTHALSMQ